MSIYNIQVKSASQPYLFTGFVTSPASPRPTPTCFYLGPSGQNAKNATTFRFVLTLSRAGTCPVASTQSGCRADVSSPGLLVQTYAGTLSLQRLPKGNFPATLEAPSASYTSSKDGSLACGRCGPAMGAGVVSWANSSVAMTLTIAFSNPRPEYCPAPYVMAFRNVASLGPSVRAWWGVFCSEMRAAMELTDSPSLPPLVSRPVPWRRAFAVQDKRNN